MNVPLFRDEAKNLAPIIYVGGHLYKLCVHLRGGDYGCTGQTFGDINSRSRCLLSVRTEYDEVVCGFLEKREEDLHGRSFKPSHRYYPFIRCFRV